MIIISEYKISNEQIQRYKKQNIRFAYGYEEYHIGSKEAVGFLLKDLYKSTIDLIERLLYFKHNVTLKLDDKVYKLNTLDDWKYTIQSPKDALKTRTQTHPIYQAYLDKRREFLDKQKTMQITIKNQYILDTYKDHEIDEAFLDAFKFRYQIDYDPESIPDKLNAYNQLKFYIDNNIDYESPAPVIPYDETPFATMVDTSYLSKVEEPDITSYGNELFLEDVVYKTSTI